MENVQNGKNTNKKSSSATNVLLSQLITFGHFTQRQNTAHIFDVSYFNHVLKNELHTDYAVNGYVICIYIEQLVRRLKYTHLFTSEN